MYLHHWDETAHTSKTNKHIDSEKMDSRKQARKTCNVGCSRPSCYMERMMTTIPSYAVGLKAGSGVLKRKSSPGQPSDVLSHTTATGSSESVSLGQSTFILWPGIGGWQGH